MTDTPPEGSKLDTVKGTCPICSCLISLDEHEKAQIKSLLLELVDNAAKAPTTHKLEWLRKEINAL